MWKTLSFSLLKKCAFSHPPGSQHPGLTSFHSLKAPRAFSFQALELFVHIFTASTTSGF